jgi:hypothetical protein
LSGPSKARQARARKSVELFGKASARKSVELSGKARARGSIEFFGLALGSLLALSRTGSSLQPTVRF